MIIQLVRKERLSRSKYIEALFFGITDKFAFAMNLIEMNNNTTGVKIVYILLDGVGDLPHKDLDNLTPLDAAQTPNMDHLAQNGCMGESVTVKEGLAPQSDIAVFNMLGYSFEKSEYVGRGVVETVGCDVDFRNGDLAMRGNFATIDNDSRIIDRRAGRNITKAEADSICQTLSNRIKFSDPEISCDIEPTIAHRLIVRFRHDSLVFSNKVTNTDPAYLKINGIGVVNQSTEETHLVESRPEDDTQAALLSAKTINEFSNQALSILKSHPVNDSRRRERKPLINAILLRDSGNKLPEIEPIKKRYNLETAAVVDMPVEIGISRILGMKVLPVTETGDFRTKATISAENLHNMDCIYVHLKGPDEFGHDGDPIGKKKSIEDIDRSFFGTLLDRLNPDLEPFVIISADHSTPCVKKAHSADPVPVLFSGTKIKTDGSKRFTEKYGAAGSLGLLKGSCVLSAALEKLIQ